MSEFNYFSAVDQRPLTREFEEWETVAQRNTIYTMITVVIVTVTSCVVGYYYDYKLITIICNLPAIKLLRNKNVYILTGIYVRQPIIKTILTIISFLTPISLIINVNEALKKKMISILQEEVKEMMISFNKSRKTLDNNWFKNKKHNISTYWANKGLDVKRLNKESTCVRFETLDPINERKQIPDGINFIDEVTTTRSIRHHVNEWGFSDMSDEMHTRSLHKRVASEKIEPSLKVEREFSEIVLRNTTSLDEVKLDNNQLIIKALSTSGTAGQYAKKSQIEEIWKNPTNQSMIDLWKDRVERNFLNTFLTNYIPEPIIGYMLYRKREILPYDENGDIKITRLMNSPNLITRVQDSVVHGKMNEAIVRARTRRIANVGINIFVELKMILVRDVSKIVIEWDISDFDGGQTAHQLAANCNARLEYGIRINQKIEELAYMIPRYKRHIIRIVRSTWGITYIVIGQQASGDNTTSDDNSEKSAAFVVLFLNKLFKKLGWKVLTEKDFEKELKTNSNKGAFVTKSGIIGEWHASTHGDDAVIVMTDCVGDHVQMSELIEETGRSLGWKVKKEELVINKSLQDGRAKFLSHGVKPRTYIDSENKLRLTFATVVRDLPRLINKWAKNAEMTDDYTKENLAKLTSKYMSFLMTSLGQPLIMALSLYAMIKLRSYMIVQEGQYTWAGIKAQTVADILLTNMISMQVPIDWNGTVWRYIELIDDETDEVLRVLYDMEKHMNETLISTGSKERVYSLQSTIEKNRFDYQLLLDKSTKYMKIMDKISHITKPKESIVWWETVDQKEQNIKMKESEEKALEKEKITSCGHVEENNYKNKSQFRINIMCEECWEKRKERVYEQINIQLIKVSTTKDDDT